MYQSISWLHVKREGIAPGDVFHHTFGSRPNGLPDHSQVTVVSVDREAGVMSVERIHGGEIYDLPLRTLDVCGGPKIVAANADRDLVRKVAIGCWWVG